MKEFKRKINKAFTLVELVVVIAVIAVLGAVSVAAYMGVINSANLSADQAEVRQMNDILTTLKITENLDNEKPTTVKKVLDGLYANGFDVKNMDVHTSGMKYCYDLSDNQMYLVKRDDGTVSYPEGKTIDDNTYAFWKGDTNSVVTNVNSWIVVQDGSALVKYITEKTSTSVCNICLNGTFLDISNITPSSNINLYNGYYYSSGKTNEKRGIDSSVSLKIKRTITSVTSEKTENAYFDLSNNSNDSTSTINDLVSATTPGKTITFKDVIFSGMNDGRNGYKGTFKLGADVEKIVFENCDFIGSFKYSLTLGVSDSHKAVEIEVKDCNFYQTCRGINICSLPTESTVKISGCTFNLYDDNNERKANCIQLGNKGCLEKQYNYSISNNIIENANALVTIHEGCCDALTNGEVPQDFVDSFSTSGTTLKDKDAKYVDIDPQPENSAHTPEILNKIKSAIEPKIR